MRSCILVTKILMLGLLIPSALSCSSGDETPPYTTAGSKPNTNTTRDAGTSSDAGTIVTMDCSVNGTAGCPCTEAGATTDCGRIDYISGDYVTCVIGTATCDGTQWGVCQGNRIVAQNHRGHALTTSGIQLLSVTAGCDIPCDPACTKVTGQQTDVDAGTLTFSDAGISITGTTGAGPGSGPCKGLWCQVQSCQGKPKTSLSGKVYDPAGKNPLYNAYVYVPVDPSVALPAFASGASCDTCSGAGAVSAIAVAQTGPDGKFTLNNVPAGADVALVVQMGKWRRMITLPTVNACEDNAVAPDYSRLPRNQTDGYGKKADIPKIAIASGDADPFECLLLKAGVDPDEIKAPGNNTRVEYYVENGIDRSPGGAPSGSTLTSTKDALMKYDVVLLPCEGKENDSHVTDVANLAWFADHGGRIFTTHYGYSWLATPINGVAQNKSEFYGTADWSKLSQSDYNDPMSGLIDQSFPKGAAFAQWLQNLGATTTLGSLRINEPRHDARSAINPPSQRWVYGSSRSATNGIPDMLLSMTFNTPTKVAQDQQCGRVVYSDFHVSADAMASTTPVTCSTDNDCGVTSVCNPATPGLCAASSCKTNTDCWSGFSCTGSAQGTCSRQTCYSNTECGTGRSCPGGVTGACEVACFGDSDCSSVSNRSACSGETLGACSSLTCTADADCGGGGATCAGESIGSCKPVTTSCFKDQECTGLNALATCSGEVTGTCSTACKANSDCGAQACSGFKAGACVPPARTCYSTADCTSLNAGSTCSGGAIGACAAGTCKVNADCGSGTCSGAVLGICKKNGNSYNTCYSNADCTNGRTCSANPTATPSLGSCSLNSCKTNTDCGGRSCNGEAVGSCVGPTGTSCWANPDCSGLGAGYTCSGAVVGSCPAKSGCTGDADCGGTRTCSGENAGTCIGPTKTCWANTDCSTLGASFSCNSAVLGSCSAVSCESNANCGSKRTCQGAVAGSCSRVSLACGVDSTCTSRYGNTAVCAGETAGTCSAGTCYSSADCGSTGACTNGALGTCNLACTSDAQCGSLKCVSGKCQGCVGDGTCQSASCVGDIAAQCSAASSMFPLTCKNGDLSAQEKALEFMLFDLSACVSPDSWTPPVPGIAFAPVTFNLDFMANCPSDKRPIWREFDWQAQIPASANIAFKVQTADLSSNLTAAHSVALATSTSSTALPGWDVAIIDTTASGAFQKVDPPIMSRSYLRVATTLSPTTDLKASPTLINWEVHYDCVYSQ